MAAGSLPYLSRVAGKGRMALGSERKARRPSQTSGELVQRPVWASRSDACSAQHSVLGGGGEATTRRPARPIEPLLPFGTPLPSLFGVQILPLTASQLRAIGLSATAHSGMSLAPQ